MNIKAKQRKRQRAAAKKGNTQKGGPSKETVVTRPKTSSTSSSTTTTLCLTTTTEDDIEEDNHQPKKLFLTPADGIHYTNVLAQHYNGFAHVPANHMPTSFHQQTRKAFEKLRDSGFFQYDCVMAGGKHLSRTFVKRTLVGEPGITYKYLGLRLFAHAWSGPRVSPMLSAMQTLNDEMMAQTHVQLTRHPVDPIATDGSSRYNLTLINYMEPSCNPKLGLKEEAAYGMGKVSVSWHADSSLQDYSSIGVYHCLPAQKASKWDWKLALRPTPTPSTSALSALQPSTPVVLPVAVPTSDGDLYFLLGTFNHSHQHAVLAGSSAYRISSTHRVAVTESDTFSYMAAKATQSCRHGRNAIKILRRRALKNTPHEAKEVALEETLQHHGETHTELECEWLAQYWLQGAQHHVLHTSWHQPMDHLTTLWQTMENQCFTLVTLALEGQDVSLLKLLASHLTKRETLRASWDTRRNDKIYRSRIAKEFQPVNAPDFSTQDPTTTFPKALGSVRKALAQRINVLVQRVKKTGGR